MLHGFWTWLTATDTGLTARIIVGVLIFSMLAVFDLRRHGAKATRWREYAFLLLAVIAALVYGVINDQITSRISWEYFYYGKGLDAVLGNRIPPDAAALHWHAAIVGIKATWSAGLLIGVALLLANNPSRRKAWPQLSYARLNVALLIVFLTTAIFAALLGAAGFQGILAAFSADFAEMLRRDEFRPHRFMCVFGVHFGGYIGGLIGTIIAVIQIRIRRGKVFLLEQSRDQQLISQMRS